MTWHMALPRLYPKGAVNGESGTDIYFEDEVSGHAAIADRPAQQEGMHIMHSASNAPTTTRDTMQT